MRYDSLLSRLLHAVYRIFITSAIMLMFIVIFQINQYGIEHIFKGILFNISAFATVVLFFSWLFLLFIAITRQRR